MQFVIATHFQLNSDVEVTGTGTCHVYGWGGWNIVRIGLGSFQAPRQAKVFRLQGQ